MSDDLVKRLRTDPNWMREDYPQSEAADRIEAQAARIAELEAALATARRDAMEEAAQIADGYHQRAVAWAKTVRGLDKHIDETDSSRIAATIRAALEGGKKDG